MLKKPRSLIGLDIGSNCVKAVELTLTGNDLVLTGYGQSEIDLPQDLRRIPNSGMQGFSRGSGNLELVEEAGSGPELGQQRNEEHDNAHASEPLSEAAPEKHSARNRLDI